MRNYFFKVFIILFVFALSLPACTPSVTEIPVIVETATTVPPVNATATPAKRSLTICLGEEPNTLYPYGSLNSAARSVLSAIYDGPMDVRDYGYEPIILEKIPSLEDKDAQLSPVSVSAGSKVVDSN